MKIFVHAARAFGAAFLVATVAPAHAATIYTDRAAWEAAVTAAGAGAIVEDAFSNDIENADNIVLDSGIVSEITGPINLGNTVMSGNYVGFVNKDGVETAWTMPASVFAIGGDFLALNVPVGLTITGDFDGTGSQTISIALAVGKASGFFGLVGAAIFSEIVWASNNGEGTTSGEVFGIDNFTFVEPDAVAPLPAALPLFLTGFAGLFASRRKRAVAA